MKRLALGLALLLLVSPAWATLYYFSDCATGGSGTTVDPYCIDPDVGGSAVKRSFDYLMDGAGTEVAAGDTIFLGCGVPIGTGTCTYYIEGHAATAPDPTFDAGHCGGVACVGFDPEVSGTAGNPITIAPYCSGGACATVHISGDSNNDGAYNESAGSLEVEYMIDNVDDVDYPRERCGGSPINCGGQDYYTIDGDGTLNDHVPRIIFEKYAKRCLSLRRGGGGWNTHDFECQWGGAGPLATASAQTEGFYPAPTLAGDGGYYAQGCDPLIIDGALDTYSAIIVSRMYGAPANDISYLTLQHQCLNGIRQLNNCNGSNEVCSGADAPGASTYDHWTLTDVQGLAQWHQGRFVTATHWTARDFYNGIGVEEQEQDLSFTDSDIGAIGAYRISSSGKSNYGISVNKGDNDADCDMVDGGGNDCNTQNITISRNRVWGSQFYPGSTTPGFLMGGIKWSGANQAGVCTNCFLENNFVWYTQDSDTNLGINEAALAVTGEDPVTVRNNTLYYNSSGAILRGAAHIFTNNLIVKANGASGAGNRPEIWIAPTAALSTVQFNDFSDAGDGGTVACMSIDEDWANPSPGSIGMCNTTTAPFDIPMTCANINSGGSPGPTLGLVNGASNKCAAPLLSNIAGVKSTWDLHLNSGDTVAKDAGSAFGSCATLDIDSMTRSGNGSACDIGADELIAVAAGRRRVIASSGD